MHRTLAGWLSLIFVGCAAGGAGAGPGAPSAAVPTGSPVRPGIEVLLADSAAIVRGRGVGLVTNQSGVDRTGVSDVERLRGAGVRLVALFSPEHGFRGAAEPGEQVATSRDAATGLPIYSLYGATVAPTDTMLAGVEVLLVDLQDAGARYFTYLATTVEVMRSAAKHGIRVVVLDRPNPLGGAVQGNVLSMASSSFVGRIAVPMRHGLTLGELALLANADLNLGATVSVVPVGGWRRSEYFDATGLPFIPPSPNLKSLESLLHYPGTCLFEGTNLSVGRGTDAPFEQIGAPWLDPARVLATLPPDARRGVRFRAVAFTPHRPGEGKYADTAVVGIRLEVTDRAAYDPPATAVYLLAAIRAVHSDKFAWIPAHFDRLAGGAGLREALSAGRAPAEIVAGWAAERKAYLERRRGVLKYGE